MLSFAIEDYTDRFGDGVAAAAAAAFDSDDGVPSGTENDAEGGSSGEVL